MEKQTISLYVNSSPHQIEIGPKTTLLEVLWDAEWFVHLAGRWFLPELAIPPTEEQLTRPSDLHLSFSYGKINA